MNVRSFLLALAVAAGSIPFQNCSNVGFSSGQQSSNTRNSLNSESNGDVTGLIHQPGIFASENELGGIIGGHFDLDTSTKIYPASQGTTNHHVHEYDKKFRTTTVDFFNLLDSKFDNIQDSIPAGKKFILNIVNAQLSPGGALELNGTLSQVSSFQRGTVFTLGAAGLRSLRLGFSPNVLANSGLVPTATGCVRANDSGKFGEYRNGALTIQALDSDSYAIDSVTGAASSGLLWEATLFWHWEHGCR